MADDPIVQKFLALLRKELRPLLHSGDEDAGVGYADTREPIEYDYHMPPTLLLKHIRHDPELSSRLTENLADTFSQRKLVKDRSIDLDAIETSFIRTRNLVFREAVAEECVRDVQRGIYNTISCSLATLVCFDVDNSELQEFRDVFVPFNSDEPNTKGDLLIGCQTRTKDTATDWGSLWPSLIEPRDLREPYFRVLHTEETKNIRAGNPRAILGIFIIVWCLEKGYLTSFWPRNDCDGCPRFRKSHIAADSSQEPPDEPLLDGEAANDALLTTTDLEPLQIEIKRLVALASVYQTRYNIPADEKQTVRKQKQPKAAPKQTRKVERKPVDSETETEVDELEEFMEYKDLLEDAMDKANSELRLPADITDGLLRWVVNGAYMLIQVWAHMVRHNGTFAHLTSYNLGLIMTRHRATQTLGISDFVEYSDAPILRATALTVYAYNDAVERYDEHVARGQPLWIKDPYRGETKAAQAAEKEAAKRKARNVAAPSSSEDEDNDDDDDSEDDHDNDDGGNDSNGDDDDGPSGGNGGARGGAGGGGGGDYPGSGSAPSRGGPGGNDGSGSEAKGSAAREARATKWAGRTRGASYLDLGIELNNSDLTPVQDDSSVHFPEGLGLGAALQEYPLDQRRRLSAGSARSSASSASTRTSVPSLFSEQASSTPTSPSTTASFAHASRDSSPFPEKANHHADPHPSISATVCDAAGILIDDVLGESAIGTVWSGKMILEDDSDDDSSIAIAVKMAVPRNNGDEEENCYGAFEDRTGTVALVLDNAGTALKSFKTPRKRSRRALFAKAIEMHSVGICHNDLVPRNIIQDSEGELTILIVDFHIADLDHRCPGKDKCRELLKFRAALNL